MHMRVLVSVCMPHNEKKTKENTEPPDNAVSFGKGNRFLSHSQQQETVLTPTAPPFSSHTHTLTQTGIRGLRGKCNHTVEKHGKTLSTLCMSLVFFTQAALI